MSETGARITRRYGNFRGVDFREEDDNLARSPDSLNVWRDYRNKNSIRTRPGFKSLVGDSTVYGMFFHGNRLYVHEGENLVYYWRTYNGYEDRRVINTIDGLFYPCALRNSNFFMYGDDVYFMDGNNYWLIRGTTITDVTEIAHVPTTSIARKAGTEDTPSGGTTLEDVNLLSFYRINTFILEGENQYAWLDARDIDSSFTPEITVDGVAGVTRQDFEVDYEKGRILFFCDIPAPKTDGQDNVTVKFKVKRPEIYYPKVENCTLVQVFDNRVFFSGNPNYPNMVWHSSLNDPTYVSDLDKYQEGLDNAPVKGIVAGNNALWVFREPSAMNTTIFYHTPYHDADYGKIYPSQHSSITTGCIGKAINFNDDICFFSNRGMEGMSGDVTTEQAVSHRSSLVDRKMLAESNYKDMVLAEWEGYLFVFIGSKAYLADSRKMFSNENHAEYEWFYWDLGVSVKSAVVKDGVLYLGTNSGIYTMTTETEDGEYVVSKDNGKAIESYWVTPKDRFSAQNKLKTTNKRGCVVEATGDIDVYAKTEDTDFELIGSYQNVTDYFASRIKRKKFKDIQLKFYSKTSFSLETATLECFIGGYIKR